MGQIKYEDIIERKGQTYITYNSMKPYESN